MDYSEALRYLSERSGYDRGFVANPFEREGVGLERTAWLLRAVGNPERRYPSVHIAGTKGKGSTAACLASILAAAGYRVGLYTSPHLHTFRERIQIAGRPIDPELFAVLTAELAAANAALVGEHPDWGEATAFEFATALALLAFARAGVDVAVVEVGLGGRLDATNAVAASIAVVTGVAMDHEAILGDTLAAIAAEKAGIFKPRQRVVIGASGEPAAVPLLVDHARAASVDHITTIDDAAIASVPPVALAGAHQRRNAAVALAALDELNLACDRITVLANVSHPGRYEVAGDLILDGAHNPHGARALAATLREQAVRPALVIAVSSDKDARQIAEALAPEVSAVIATRYQQERALDPAVLAGVFRSVVSTRTTPLPEAVAPALRSAASIGTLEPERSAVQVPPRAPAIPIEAAPDLESAVAAARAYGTPVLIAGSLFLVGEARTRYLGAPTDPIVATESLVRR